jgi:hypothetical protein
MRPDEEGFMDLWTLLLELVCATADDTCDRTKLPTSG